MVKKTWEWKKRWIFLQGKVEKQEKFPENLLENRWGTFHTKVLTLFVMNIAFIAE